MIIVHQTCKYNMTSNDPPKTHAMENSAAKVDWHATIDEFLGILLL